MIRALLVLLALLVPAPLALHAAGPAAHSAPPPAVSPGQGAFVSFDVPDLGRGPTWILWPVTRDVVGEVRVTFSGSLWQEGRVQGAALVAAFPDATRPVALSGGTSWGSQLAAANAAGAHVASPEGSLNGAGSRGRVNATGAAGPTQTAWIGVLTTDCAPGSRENVLVEGLGATVRVGAPRVGHSVRAFDLVDEAQKAGANAQVLGQEVGAPGAADVKIAAAPTVLALVSAQAQGDQRGHLALTAEGATKLDAALQDAWAHALYAGPGPFEARLDNVRDPQPLLPSGSGPTMPLEAVLLVASLDVPIRGQDLWTVTPR